MLGVCLDTCPNLSFVIVTTVFFLLFIFAGTAVVTQKINKWTAWVQNNNKANHIHANTWNWKYAGTESWYSHTQQQQQKWKAPPTPSPSVWLCVCVRMHVFVSAKDLAYTRDCNQSLPTSTPEKKRWWRPEVAYLAFDPAPGQEPSHAYQTALCYSVRCVASAAAATFVSDQYLAVATAPSSTSLQINALQH